MAGDWAMPAASRVSARFIGDLPGRFVLLDRSSADGEGQSFPFTARSVATTRAVVTTDVAVERGERVALRFDEVGVRQGVIERSLREGFIVNFDEEPASSEDVGARIDWLNKKTRGRAEERRRHKRVIPKRTAALAILGTDNHVACRIQDMSSSGVAVLSDMQPVEGILLAIGAVPGRVVRHFDGGFAVQFLELQNLDELEALLTLSTRREKTLAARRLGFGGSSRD